MQKVRDDATVGKPKLEPKYKTAVSRAVELLYKQTGTQKAAAARIGVNQTQFGRYLAGTGEPSLPSILKLADALNLSLDEMLGRDGKLGAHLSQHDVERIADAVFLKNRQSSVPPSSRKVPTPRPQALPSIPPPTKPSKKQ